MLEENCYLLWDETNECVIIDCGAFYDVERQEIVNFIKDENLSPKHLLCTHGHIDHHFGINTIHEAFGLSPEISQKDADLMASLPEQAMTLLQMNIDYAFPKVEHYLESKERIKFGSHELQVIETPGHTRGGVTFYCAEENIAFTGDTLFKGSVGRTDLPGGNMFQLISSLRELSQLPDNTIIHSGHGPQTTLGFELAHNPYLDR